jgi:hypothetical protein
MNTDKEIKERIIAAGYKAIDQLIKVSEEDIIKPDADDDLAADKLKAAAQAKKLAIFDAFEILSRIENEKELLKSVDGKTEESRGGFAERRARKSV